MQKVQIQLYKNKIIKPKIVSMYSNSTFHSNWIYSISFNLSLTVLCAL